MPIQIAQLIGGPGTGKTRELIEVIMEKQLERLQDPHLLGFVSFTRAARREASRRAADKFNLNPKELEGQGWFRTVHSVAKRCLGVGKELLTDTKESREWIENALQERLDGSQAGGDVEDQEYLDPFADADSEPARALQLWSVARNRLEPLEAAWARAEECDDQLPPLTRCREIVEQYEQAKRLDHRVDFTDLLALFAGYALHPDAVWKQQPDGEPPREVEAWLLDEQQDNSPLLHAVCQRLVNQPGVRWATIAGDPFQSIYGWAGADHRSFLDGWPVAKQRIMPQSYRCAAPILALGEALLRDCSDYFDRRIAPAPHKGTIEDRDWHEGLDGLVDPRESWLLLARTNFQAARLARQLDEAGIPWLPTRGGGHWQAPVRLEAFHALANLQAGAPIDGREWQSILKHLPAKIRDGPLLAHGMKTQFLALDAQVAQERHPWVMPEELTELGATPLLVDLIQSGRWTEIVEGAEEWTSAAARWGEEAVNNPKVRVGTIHSAKGAQADNVLVLTTISKPCWQSAQTAEGSDENQRVKYVSVTRARRRLVILNERKPKFRWRIEP